MPKRYCFERLVVCRRSLTRPKTWFDRSSGVMGGGGVWKTFRLCRLNRRSVVSSLRVAFEQVEMWW